MTELIDSHCHLNYEYEGKTVEVLLREAQEAGVASLITIGVDLATLPQTVGISEKFPQVFHTAGVHPHEAITLSESDLPTLEAAALHPKCRAIGEIGLDFHYDHSPREVQISRLEWQLDLALRSKLPVVIHSREAEAELLPLLTAYARNTSAGVAPGVLHCFSGTQTIGKACLDLGFYVSFSGILTFKKADEIRDCAREFPLDRILVETDAPYLAPVPFRGKKCEPAMVRWTAQKLGEIRGLSFEEIARETTANARKLFGI